MTVHDPSMTESFGDAESRPARVRPVTPADVSDRTREPGNGRWQRLGCARSDSRSTLAPPTPLPATSGRHRNQLLTKALGPSTSAGTSTAGGGDLALDLLDQSGDAAALGGGRNGQREAGNKGGREGPLRRRLTHGASPSLFHEGPYQGPIISFHMNGNPSAGTALRLSANGSSAATPPINSPCGRTRRTRSCRRRCRGTSPTRCRSGSPTGSCGTASSVPTPTRHRPGQARRPRSRSGRAALSARYREGESARDFLTSTADPDG